MAPRLAVAATDVRLTNVGTRFPFEFGIATMRRLPHCFVAVDLAVDGERTRGLAADHFPPKWLTKDPDLSLAAEADAMLAVVERACAHAEAAGADTVFDLWHAVYDAQRAWAADTDHPPLLWNFGVALVERAVIDAFCRATETTFADAVAENALGIRPGEIYPELAGEDPGAYLPDPPASSIAVRHTVGHGDQLRGDGTETVDDGLPVTLVENVEAYGLERFKIKLAGDPEGDIERLGDVLAVLEETCDAYAFTIDANEQYDSVADLRTVIERFQGDAGPEGFTDRLLFVEQPFARGEAFSEAVSEGLEAWTDGPPVIIDESDGPLRSMKRALEAGYAGTSYKNCKGVIKGVVNATLAATRREAGEEVVISGEDLTTIGPVSLQQDLAAMATVGVGHVERNGHHYFRGLSMFDDGVQAAVLDAHPDLYRALPDGTAALDISDGRVELDTVLAAPFGYACDVDPTRFATPDEWSFPTSAE